MGNFSSLKGEFVPFLLKKQMQKSTLRAECNGEVESVKNGNRTNSVSDSVGDIPDTQSDLEQSVTVNKTLFHVCISIN